jgi:aspartyl-tRNA(Asn)/glutamyl-tRNA(Gln) amidotransferase subunit A
MSFDVAQADATAIASAIQAQTVSAVAVTQAALERITQYNQVLNCFTTVLSESALHTAAQIDQAIATGKSVGPLAGVPFAVKNLFDIDGVVTIAGAKINAENPPATRDATAVSVLK